MPVRHPEFLRHRYRAILGYTGLLSLIASLLILAPLALLPFYPDSISELWGYLVPGLVLGLCGLLLWRSLTPRPPVSLNWQEGAVIVVLTWLLVMLVGSIPFMATNGLSFVHALFESTSGWTTAGLSVLDIEAASPLLLFYRSATQLAGGAGLAILMLSALAGPLGPGLSIAEGRSEQLLPHVRRSARLVLTIYLAYVLVGIAGLRVAGMGWFDAVNHAFTALSTGGFSTHTESLAYWQSPAVEAVTIVLMLLGTVSFVTAYTLFQGKVKLALRNSEVRQTALLIFVGTVVLLLGVTPGLYASAGERVRVAVFNSVSALSTTGFSSADYRPWSGLGWLVLILLMLMGGGAGSTAGGIKQHRIYVLYRGLIWEFRRRLLPDRVVTEPDVWQGEDKQFITDRHLRQIALFVFFYLAVFFVGSGIIAAYGYPLEDSMFEFASSLSTVGISVGITTADAPAGVLWTEMAAMFLGRLEFFTIIVGLIKFTSDLPSLAVSGFRHPSRVASIILSRRRQHARASDRVEAPGVESRQPDRSDAPAGHEQRSAPDSGAEGGGLEMTTTVDGSGPPPPRDEGGP